MSIIGLCARMHRCSFALLRLASSMPLRSAGVCTMSESAKTRMLLNAFMESNRSLSAAVPTVDFDLACHYAGRRSRALDLDLLAAAVRCEEL